MVEVEITTIAFDPWLRIKKKRETLTTKHYGANSIFVGSMRDFNQDKEVTSMFLEHYPEMTQKKLHLLAEEVSRKFSIGELLVVHRVGEILPGDPIVLVAVWSIHRKEALAACQEMIETLKHQAPFWKQEKLVNGSKHWVKQIENNPQKHTTTTN